MLKTALAWPRYGNDVWESITWYLESEGKNQQDGRKVTAKPYDIRRCFHGGMKFSCRYGVHIGFCIYIEKSMHEDHRKGGYFMQGTAANNLVCWIWDFRNRRRNIPGRSPAHEVRVSDFVSPLHATITCNSARYANCDARFERTDEQALVASLLTGKLLGYDNSKAMTTLRNNKRLT